MDRSTPPIADQMREAHVALLRGLSDLRAAVVPPSRPKAADVRARLDAVSRQLAEHFRLEEAGCYMADVRQRHPRPEQAVQRLAAEHADGPGRSNCHLGSAIAVWIDSVRWHEDRENRLIEDAFDLDLGPGD